ncbi:MAG: NADH-quinone oxidoreductase subunit C [DPANN group archaeon]|nr:NADH-quinone oxidoreductase subunit C [DPANN group archaeon]
MKAVLKELGNLYKQDNSGYYILVKDLEEALSVLMKLGIYRISNITGCDTGEVIEVIYTFIWDNIPINLKIEIVRDNPKINTIIGMYPGAKLYERELSEMLGVKIVGNDEPENLFLAHDSPKTPLRK